MCVAQQKKQTMTSRGIKKPNARRVVNAVEEAILVVPADAAGIRPFSCVVSTDTINEWLLPQTTADVMDFITSRPKIEVDEHTKQMGKVVQALQVHSTTLAADSLKKEYLQVKEVISTHIATFLIMSKVMYKRKAVISRAWGTMYKGADTL